MQLLEGVPGAGTSSNPTARRPVARDAVVRASPRQPPQDAMRRGSSGEPRNTRRLVAVAGRRRASPAIWWSAVRSKRAPFWCVPPVLEQKPTILAQHSLRRDLRGGDHATRTMASGCKIEVPPNRPCAFIGIRIPFVFMLLSPFFIPVLEALFILVCDGLDGHHVGAAG